MNASRAPVLALTFALVLGACGGERVPPPTTPGVVGTPAAPPPNDAPEPIVARYFEHLDREVEDARRKLEIARKGDDKGEAVQAHHLLTARVVHREAELERLAGRSDGMMATGIIAIAIGGTAIVAGGLGTLISEVQDGEPPTATRATTIGVTAGGAVLLGSGVTLLVLGRGTPPKVGDEAQSHDAAHMIAPPEPGVMLRWTY